MSFFHSHCKECGKSISWGWNYCSLDCEQAENMRYRELVNKAIKYDNYTNERGLRS